jgi:hypothetical protein
MSVYSGSLPASSTGYQLRLKRWDRSVCNVPQHSQSYKEVFTTIICSLKDGNTSLKTVQKLLINSVGERDFSAQETCHLLLSYQCATLTYTCIFVCQHLWYYSSIHSRSPHNVLHCTSMKITCCVSCLSCC